MQNEIGATGGPAVPNAGGGGTVRNRNNSIKESAKMVRIIENRPGCKKFQQYFFKDETFVSLQKAANYFKGPIFNKLSQSKNLS